MDNEIFIQFIKNAILYYDNKQIEYKKYNYNKSFVNTKVLSGASKSGFFCNFTLEDDSVKEHEYELLGLYDINTSVWTWSWVIADIEEELCIISKDLLYYGLKINVDESPEYKLTKLLLINSRILIEEDTSLNANIAIFSYLCKDRFKFIYQNIEDNIIYFYLIK